MKEDKIIKGKRVLVVDDEEDVLETLAELLEICKIDTAGSFEEAKKKLEKNEYDIAVLDIMGVDGYELLKVANRQKIPALMLTANALSEGNLRQSAKSGAAYYAPKEKMMHIRQYIADVLDAIDKGKSPWQNMFDRLGGYYDTKFYGPDWREKEKEFWRRRLKQRIDYDIFKL